MDDNSDEVEYEDMWDVSHDIHELLEILIYTIKNNDDNNKIKQKNEKIKNFENKFEKLSSLIHLHNELIMRENASKAAHVGILLERNAYAKKIILIEEELLKKSSENINMNNVNKNYKNNQKIKEKNEEISDEEEEMNNNINNKNSNNNNNSSSSSSSNSNEENSNENEIHQQQFKQVVAKILHM